MQQVQLLQQLKQMKRMEELQKKLEEEQDGQWEKFELLTKLNVSKQSFSIPLASRKNSKDCFYFGATLVGLPLQSNE